MDEATLIRADLEGALLDLRQVIAALNVSRAAFENQDAFNTTMVPEDVAGMFDVIKNNLTNIEQSITKAARFKQIAD